VSLPLPADSRFAWVLPMSRSLPLPDHLAGAVAVAGGDGAVHRYDAAAFFLA